MVNMQPVGAIVAKEENKGETWRTMKRVFRWVVEDTLKDGDVAAGEDTAHRDSDAVAHRAVYDKIPVRPSPAQGVGRIEEVKVVGVVR